MFICLGTGDNQTPTELKYTSQGDMCNYFFRLCLLFCESSTTPPRFSTRLAVVLRKFRAVDRVRWVVLLLGSCLVNVVVKPNEKDQ